MARCCALLSSADGYLAAGVWTFHGVGADSASSRLGVPDFYAEAFLDFAHLAAKVSTCSSVAQPASSCPAGEVNPSNARAGCACISNPCHQPLVEKGLPPSRGASRTLSSEISSTKALEGQHCQIICSCRIRSNASPDRHLPSSRPACTAGRPRPSLGAGSEAQGVSLADCGCRANRTERSRSCNGGAVHAHLRPKDGEALLERDATKTVWSKVSEILSVSVAKWIQRVRALRPRRHLCSAPMAIRTRLPLSHGLPESPQRRTSLVGTDSAACCG